MGCIHLMYVPYMWNRHHCVRAWTSVCLCEYNRFFMFKTPSFSVLFFSFTSRRCAHMYQCFFSLNRCEHSRKHFYFSYFFHCPSFVRSFFWFNCFERKNSKWFDFLKKNRLRFNTIDHIKENMEISLMEKCMAIIERSSLE